MAENTPTPSGEKSTKPDAPVVPAEAVKPATEAKPVSSETPKAEATPPVEPAKPNEPAKPAETPPVEEPAKPPEEKPVAAVVPEKYEFVLEGDQKISQPAIDAITPALKEAGVTQAAAAKLVTDFVAYQAGLPAAKNAADLDAIRQDPQIGMLNFGRTQQTINEALAAFTTPAERAELSKMGMANDPRLVRMFLRIGRAMSEAPQDDTGGRVPEAKTIAQRLYGKPPAEAKAN